MLAMCGKKAHCGNQGATTMSSMQTFEANLGTRNEAEVASLLLDHAREHLTNKRDTSPVTSPVGLLASAQGLANVVGDLQAIVLLANLSLLVFPEQEVTIRRGGL
jgi:hypothetical protein